MDSNERLNKEYEWVNHTHAWNDNYFNIMSNDATLDYCNIFHSYAN